MNTAFWYSLAYFSFVRVQGLRPFWILIYLKSINLESISTELFHVYKLFKR